jgi:transforming growth factor-beta-induced protein
MKFLLTHAASLLAVAAATAVVLVNAQDNTVRPTLDIPSTAVNAGIFNTLVTALDITNLIGPLSTPNGPYTVFAPTDDAFNALPTGLVTCLLEENNNQILTDILLYHVVTGQILSTDLMNDMTATTLQGEDVIVDLSSDGVKINDSNVVTADVLATNGVIHVIDAVLVPPSLDVVAFLETCNGSPSLSLVDIPTTAINAGIFNTLFAALNAADLVDALTGPNNGPFTVFAPTDDAFDALPDGLVTCLSKEENNDSLTALLLYHVANGEVLSTQLMNGMVVPTLLDGQNVIVDLSSSSSGSVVVKINDSNVVSADVLATNGVIHVIDAVLVPPSINVAAFLETCDANTCTYLGESRLVGEYLTGSTQTCLCSSNGFWIDCRNNNINNNDNECTYLGKSRSVGQYLIGPTQTCLCTSGGHWIDCQTNNNNNSNSNTPVVEATSLDDTNIVTLAESTTNDESSSSTSLSSYLIGSITTIIIAGVVANTAMLLL